MNYKVIFNTIGKVLRIEAILMILPVIVGVIYNEKWDSTILGFGVTIVGVFIISILLSLFKPKDTKILPRASFIIVSLSWILMALFGCLPLIISGKIPNFFDAFFEMSSGFTTTGASIVESVEDLPKSILFWRSFSHWIGGMGVIVFILAVLPDSKEGSNMHILRAESPGPQVGKLVSRISATARILYLIYIGLTVIQFLLLFLGPDDKMDLFSSICLTLGTAGTGGFSVLNSGLAEYAPYSQYVIAIFMVLFGVNFTIFYLLLIGKFTTVLKNEEVRFFLCLVVVATLFITVSLFVSDIETFVPSNEVKTFESCFRHAFFQVASIISTTGYATTDFVKWPTICLMIIFLLMFTGPCAGSTGGGIKLSRISLLVKSSLKKIKQMINPRKVEIMKDSGAIVESEVVEGAQSFFVLFIIILFLSTFLISFDGGRDVLTNFTASLSAISNVGPGLGEIVGPYGNFSHFSSFSKFVLSLTMITGRLELFPMVALFSHRTWKKR